MTYAEKVWEEATRAAEFEPVDGDQSTAIAIISAALDERYRAGVEAMRDAALESIKNINGDTSTFTSAPAYWGVVEAITEAASLLAESPKQMEEAEK